MPASQPPAGVPGGGCCAPGGGAANDHAGGALATGGAAGAATTRVDDDRWPPPREVREVALGATTAAAPRDDRDNAVGARRGCGASAALGLDAAHTAAAATYRPLALRHEAGWMPFDGGAPVAGKATAVGRPPAASSMPDPTMALSRTSSARPRRPRRPRTRAAPMSATASRAAAAVSRSTSAAVGSSKSASAAAGRAALRATGGDADAVMLPRPSVSSRPPYPPWAGAPLSSIKAPAATPPTPIVADVDWRLRAQDGAPSDAPFPAQSARSPTPTGRSAAEAPAVAASAAVVVAAAAAVAADGRRRAGRTRRPPRTAATSSLDESAAMAFARVVGRGSTASPGET